LSGRCGLVCRLPASPSNERLLAALQARGIAARAVHPAALSTSVAPAGAAGDAGDADAAATLFVCRLPSGTPPAWLLPLRLAERAGRRFVNRPSALAVAHDKPEALARLSAAGLPVPPTRCIVSGGSDDLAGLPGERFVVKPAAGASGHGVTVGLDRATAAACAAAFADASGPVLVQPLLGEGLDRRLLLAGGRLIAAMERRPARLDGRGNLVYGARATALQPSAEETALALAAVRALQLDVAAVDLLVHEGRALVLEVNSAPGLVGIERATGIDVAGALAAFVADRLAERTSEAEKV